MCEKPLVSSLREVDELGRAEARSGKRIMPIFQYRFGHGLQKLKLLIAGGLAGTAYLATVETAWRRRAAYYEVPWRGKWATERGGALLGHAIHAHDMLCYVLGPAQRVFAYTTTRVNQIEVEDCAAVALEMADGAMASLGVTLGSAAEVTRHRFSFSGLVAESNTRPYTNSGDPWTFVGDTPELTEQIDAKLGEFEPLPELYAGQFYRFYDALQHATELPVTLADARVSLELITAMYYSAETGQSVTLPSAPITPATAAGSPPLRRSPHRCARSLGETDPSPPFAPVRIGHLERRSARVVFASQCPCHPEPAERANGAAKDPSLPRSERKAAPSQNSPVLRPPGGAKEGGRGLLS